MLRVTIEMLPRGSEEDAYVLGRVFITNDGTGSLTVGNYDVELTKEPPIAKRTGTWRKGRVEGFLRKLLGPYDLLYRALIACGISERNLRPTAPSQKDRPEE